jgi:hypothetical protein
MRVSGPVAMLCSPYKQLHSVKSLCDGCDSRRSAYDYHSTPRFEARFEDQYTLHRYSAAPG